MRVKMMAKQNSSSVHAQAGAGMIEVLVAIIVLSIGLLGLAGLQTAGLKNNQSAGFRSTATMMAYGILDSMRANRVAAGEGSYNHAISEDTASEDETEEETEEETQTEAGIPGDVKPWLEELALRLPDGTGAVNVDADNKVTITIQWDDSRGALAAQQFVMTTRL
ncbi:MULTISPECIES: type IV pilus modification protein PilV [Nitrosomonas]|uniref:Type IV pilus assembly protein PilV n=3 Tax=Nitrosomonas eutropha TaxID=916 RepID=A0ABX5M798_9PROT|nr:MULTISPECIES: type IV pilus modification protein PilV [Nitrosomonas]ABI60069.1 type IV pilus modification protein PilV [Nitrosomonas eutropha C91]PXV75251.1 type IV pilus assembly protein PilV [Nitrosomonas eutropha]SDX03790.1 type IV pilus assembly protein PilV [Nitrosomonas eutropha]